MQISVNLRQQIAKMCCKSNAMWKPLTSSSGQQQQQQQHPVMPTGNTQCHGQAQRHNCNRNNKIQQHFLGRICALVFFVMIALNQMDTAAAGLREGLSGEFSNKRFNYLYILYKRVQRVHMKS